MVSIRQNCSAHIVDAWYNNSAWLKIFRPTSVLFQSLSEKRRRDFLSGKKKKTGLSVPVVVVGNITAGGTGKTPLVIAIVSFLKREGFNPGVVSRGYGSEAPYYPYVINDQSNPLEAGDEPLLIARRTQCPVIIDADRVTAAQKLIDDFCCDVIVSDDGLQHYNLARDIEICVIDGQRGLGNRRCLPEGPLRESAKRLDSVDLVVVNGDSNQVYHSNQFQMSLESGALEPVGQKDQRQKDERAGCSRPKPGEQVNAVAGIGNPERFFQQLKQSGYTVSSKAFSDHHNYVSKDFDLFNSAPIVMTEKDAVKCEKLALSEAWYLPVDAKLANNFWEQLMNRLQLSLNKE